MLVYQTTNSFIALGKLLKFLLFCSLKSYTVDAYKSALRKIDFPNYEYFEDVNRAY